VTTFVIVHGGWGGGWEWTPVARLLRGRGHEVFNLTLSGMGERSHVVTGKPIGLSTHVDDILALIEFEELHDIVLVAASYGGLPVTGAADRLADRLRIVIYVDALVPTDGQSALDLLPDRFGDMVRAGLVAHGAAWRVPIPPDLLESLMPDGSLPDDKRARYFARVTDHPAASFAEPIRLSGAIDHVPRAFIRCTTGEFADTLGGDPIEAVAARAREAGWPYRELAAPHDPQIYNPDGLAVLLEELAANT
jgi:pimeloyl-ACP methyl ester carboxylesterase